MPALARRRFSPTPRAQAMRITATIPASMLGTIGLNSSEGETPSAVAARTVGPPQGTMFMTPADRFATTVRTTGESFRRRYSGSIAETVMMNVVDPSPSRETSAARTAEPMTTRTGEFPQIRRISRISGSNNPTSIIRPK
jgi:hypothetical protein